MKKLQNNYTTPEQSKRLLELGVPADSADCVYDCALIGGEKYYSLSILEDELFLVYKRIWEDSCTDIIPCWSVGQLIEIFELCYTDRIEEHVWYNHPGKGDTIVERVMWDFINKAERLDFSKLEE